MKDAPTNVALKLRLELYKIVKFHSVIVIHCSKDVLN